MPQETQLDEGAIQALSAAGIREGDTLGGSVLTPEGTWRPTTISSSDGVSTVDKAMSDTNKTTTTTDTKTPTSETKKPTTPEDQLMQNEADKVKTPEQKAAEDIQSRADASEKYLRDTLDPIRSQLEQSKRAQIDSIYAQFNVARTQLIESNRRQTNAQQTLSIRRGGQYSPTMMAAQVEAVVQQGVQRVNELNAQEQAAIAKVNSAYNESSLSLAMKEYDGLADIRKEKDKALADMNKALAEANKKMVDENKKMNNQVLIHDAMAQGSDTVAKIYESLGGKVVTDEIKNYFDDITPKESPDKDKFGIKFSSDDAAKMIAFGLGNADDLQVLQDSTNKYGLYTPSKELGGKSISEILTPDEMKFYRDEILYPKKDKKIEKGLEGTSTDLANSIRVARLAFGSGRSMSDADRDFGEELYKKAKAEGKSVYEIADEVYGFNTERNKPLAESLRFALLGMDDEKGMSDYDMEGLARLINNGKDAEAIQKVEQTAYTLAQKADSSKFKGEHTATYYINKVQEIEKLLKDNGLYDAVGPIENLVTGKGVFARRESAAVRAKLTSIVANLRLELSGSQVTESEQKFLEPLIAALSDKKGIIKEKLNEIKGDSLSHLNAVRANYGLPELNEQELLDRKLRVPLYTRSYGQGEAGEFINNPIPDTYDSSVWGNVTP